MSAFGVKTDGLLVPDYTLVPAYSPLDTGASRRYGIEAEFFTVDPYSLQPKVLDATSLDGFGKFIKPELGADQIEISTPPLASLKELKEALEYYTKLLADLAARQKAALLPVPLVEGEHPITDSARYHLILQHLGEHARSYAPTVASDQINIGASREEEAFQIYERMRKLLPVFTGFSVASPFRNGQLGHNASERMTNYNLTLAECPDMTGYPPPMESLQEYAGALRQLPLFQHPNSYYKYLRPMPQRGVAAEVRSMDKQPTVRETMAMAALAKGLVNVPEVPEIPAPERDFHKAAKHGIYDAILFSDAIRVAAEHLGEGEAAMLQPLKEKLERGTVSDALRRRYFGGEAVDRILTSMLVKGSGDVQ